MSVSRLFLMQRPTAKINGPVISASLSFVQDFAFSLSLPAQPRLSGFLRMKKSRSRPISLHWGWKERWFVLIPCPSCVIVQYYRRKVDLLSTSVKRECIYAGERAILEPKIGGYGQYCFSFVSASGNRVFLAATSEFQRNLWISCINSTLDEGAVSFHEESGSKAVQQELLNSAHFVEVIGSTTPSANDLHLSVDNADNASC